MYMLSRITGPLLAMFRFMGPRARLDPTGSLVKAGRGGGAYTSSFHPDSERISKLHNYCQYELLLLLADIMQICMDSALKMTDVLRPIGASMGIPLSILVVNENAPSYIRAIASECVVRGLQCEDVDIMDCLSVPVQNMLSPASPEFVAESECVLLKQYAEEGDGITLLDSILKCVSMMRVPDSFKLSAAVLGALGVVEAMAQCGLYNPFEARSGDTSCCWECEWLLRLSYDRRSVIRVRALKIMAFTLPSSLVCGCGATSEDHSECSPSETSSRCGLRGLQERLRYLLMDACECLAMRSIAARMLASISMMHLDAGTSPPGQRGVDPPHQSLLLGFIAEILTPSVQTMCSSVILAAVECLLGLLCNSAYSCNDTFLGMLASLKIFPKVIAMLQVGTESDMIQSCASRCNCDADNTSSVDSNYLLMIDTVMNLSGASQMKVFCKVKYTCCRIIQRSHEMGGYHFSTALRNTNIVRNVLAAITDAKLLQYPLLKYDSVEWEDLECSNIQTVKLFFAQTQMITGYLDVASIMIARDVSKGNATAPYTSGVEMGDLVQDKGLIVTAIAYTACQHLRTILRVYTKGRTLLSNAETCQRAQCLRQVVTSICRVITLLAASSSWRVGLGLGGVFDGCEASPPATEMALVLLDLQHAYASVDNHVMQSRLAVAVCSMLERSSGLRRLVQSRVSHPSDTGSTSVPTDIARATVDSIVRCADVFDTLVDTSTHSASPSKGRVSNKWPQSTTTVPSGSGRHGTRSGAGKSALQHIKKKEKSLRAAAAASPRSPAVAGSGAESKWCGTFHMLVLVYVHPG